MKKNKNIGNPEAMEDKAQELDVQEQDVQELDHEDLGIVTGAGEADGKFNPFLNNARVPDQEIPDSRRPQLRS